MPLACTNSSDGQSYAFPDVCNTPTPSGPVPIPYPNTAMLEMASPETLCETVLICGFMGATVQTQVTASSGDEEGTLGGVTSGTVMGSCQFKQGSQSVTLAGQAATYLGSMIGHNNASNPNSPPGSVISASQSVVTVGP